MHKVTKDKKRREQNVKKAVRNSRMKQKNMAKIVIVQLKNAFFSSFRLCLYVHFMRFMANHSFESKAKKKIQQNQVKHDEKRK